MLWQFVDAKQVKFAKDKDYLATGVDDNRGISKSIRHFIRQFIRHLTIIKCIRTHCAQDWKELWDQSPLLRRCRTIIIILEIIVRPIPTFAKVQKTIIIFERIMKPIPTFAKVQKNYYHLWKNCKTNPHFYKRSRKNIIILERSVRVQLLSSCILEELWEQSTTKSSPPTYCAQSCYCYCYCYCYCVQFSHLLCTGAEN